MSIGALEHLPHLFERSHRVEGERSRQAGGTGLSLAIAHDLTQLHQGTLTVHREINRGAPFTIVFISL
jgi:signal transduction histidine kinase